MNDILQIIQEHSLSVRCLPREVVSLWSYRDGDADKYCKELNDHDDFDTTYEVVTQILDLNYFIQKKPPTYYSHLTPEQRFENYKKQYPNGRKFLKETRKVEKGGWWMVKQAKNTSNTVTFNMKDVDTFCAPTLEQAIELFLNSIAPVES